MREAFLAVDGGGSKTAFCILDRATGATQTFLSDGSNYKITQTDAERVIFLEGVAGCLREANLQTEQVRGMVMGMSGVDSEADHAHYLEIALQTGIPKEKIYVCNDSELAFYAKGAPPGLCAIAGTGSVATGIAPDGRKARSGGWSNYISDEGSGGWIGVQALRALLRYCDGYGPYDPVFDVLREHFQAETFDALPPILSRIGVQEVAAAAKPVADLADSGDVYCEKLVRQAARLIAELAASVYRKLRFADEESVDIVTAGSLFKCASFCRWFSEALKEDVSNDNLRFRGAASNPVLGGVKLAQLLFGERD